MKRSTNTRYRSKRQRKTSADSDDEDPDGGTENTVTELKTKLNEYNELVKKHKATADAAEAKATEHGTRLTAMDAELKTLKETIDGKAEEISTMSMSLKAEQKRGEELEARLNSKGAPGEKSELTTLGNQVTDLDEYKNLLRTKSHVSFDVKGSLFLIRKYAGTNQMEKKALSDASIDALVTISGDRITDIVEDAKRTLTIRDLLGFARTDQANIFWVEKTGFSQLYAQLKAVLNAGTKTMTVDNGTGFFVGQVIDIGTGVQLESGTIATVTVTPTKDDASGMTVYPGVIVLTANVTNTHVKNTQVTSDNFAYTPHTYLKPKANIVFEDKNTPVKTLAHNIPIAKQSLADFPYIQSMINNDLLYGLDYSTEYQIMYGQGDSYPNQLSGIMNNANVPTYKWSDGTAGDNKADAVRRAMTLARKAEYPVTGVVLHPDDLEHIELLKDDNGAYIILTSIQTDSVAKLFRVPVVETQSIKSGEFLLGAFGLGAQYWEREESAINVYYEHLDYAAKNMALLQAEQRGCLTVSRPEAFVAGSFDYAPGSSS